MSPLHHVRESLLPRLSLRRPVTVTMVFVALLVVGYIAYTRIPISMLPSGLEHRHLGLWVPFGNASPAEVEQQIARPVEGVLRTMSGVQSIYTNSNPGGCWAWIRFNQNVDMGDAYNQLRDRIDRLMVELPDEVRRVYIRKWNDDDIPVLGIDFLVSGQHSDLYTLVDEQVRQPLERLDGVANVRIWGADAKRVEIGLVQERINAHQVNMYRLVRQLQRDNFALSSGTVRNGSQKLYVRSDSRFSSLEEIRSLPIEGHPGLTLSDVAEVTYGPPEKNWFFRLDGNPGFGVVINKESMANTVEVVDRILGALENDILKRPQLAGIQARVYLNQGDIILDSLDQLKSAGLWGGLFAVFVLFFFLRRYRMTLVITGAIPLSILMSLTMIYFMGWSLNTVTMAGLIIGFGMVVDNSIVVTEAIYTRRVAGEDVFHASLHGASEVGLAITVSTLTTVVVFLPLIFMSGSVEMAFYMARIGMPVIFALLGSLLVALLFIPLVTSRLMSAKPPEEPKSIRWASGVYQRGLAWVMSHRLETVIVAFALFATIQIPMNKIPKSSGGHGDLFTDMWVRFNMPDYYTPQQSDSVMTQYETFLNQNREKYGIVYVQVEYWHGGGSFWAFIHPDRRPWYTVAYHNLRKKLGLPVERPLARDEALDDFRERAPRFAGVKMSIDRRQEEEQRTSVTLFGDDTQTLLRLAKEVERRLRLVPEVTEVNSDMEEGNDELQLYVDRVRAEQYGLDGNTIASTLSYVLRGLQLDAYRTPERDIEMRMGLREEDRRTLDQVKNLVVVGRNGNRATLGSLVDVRMDKGLQRISRENGKTRIVVTAISTNKDIKNLAEHITAAMDGFEMPRGYQWTLTGRFERMREQEGDLTFAIIMATAFVFLLMGILFESFILPLSVLLSIPFSFLGVYWLLYLVGATYDMMAGIGTIILIGVVVNNAIVLVDLINRLRAEGFERVEAILEAGKQRFRPILMTSGTTIFGLVPMAVGNANMIGIPYDTLGMAMIGGLVTSTFLTLFVVPLFYSLFDDLRITAGKLVGLAYHRKE